MLPARLLRQLVLLATLLAALPIAHAQSRIELWHGFSGLRAEALEQLAREFNASQKNFQVDAVFRGADLAVPHLLAAQKAGKAPHMVQLEQTGSSSLAAQRNAYRPVQAVLQEAGHKFNRANYLPGILDTYTDTLGRVMALPLGAATVALYYNSALFAKAGLDPDQVPRNWSNVRDAALKIVDEEASACALSVDRITWIMVENVLSLHGQSFTEQSGPYLGASSVSFNNRLLVRHVGMLSSWAKSGLFSYFGPREEAGERFAAGECAMLAASSALYPRLAATLGTTLRMAALPIHEDIIAPDARTLPSGNGLWVLAGKKAPDYRGAAQFLAFLARPDNQARWQQRTGDIPLTREAHEISIKSGYYVKNPWAEIAIRSTRSGGKAEPRLQQLPQIGRLREILDAELEGVWAQHRTPTEALEAATLRGTQLLRGK